MAEELAKPELGPSNRNKNFMVRLANAIRRHKKGALATGAAVTAGIGAAVGASQAIQNNRNAEPATRPNVPTQPSTENKSPTVTLDPNGRPDIHFVSKNPELRVQEYFELIDRGEIIPSYRSDFLVLPAGTVLQRTPGNINLELPELFKIDTEPFVVPEGKVVVFQYAGKLDNGEEVVYASPMSGGDLTSQGPEIYGQTLFYGFDSPGEQDYAVKGKVGTNDSVVFDSNGQPALPAPSSEVAKYRIMSEDEWTNFLRQNNLVSETLPITGP